MSNPPIHSHSELHTLASIENGARGYEFLIWRDVYSNGVFSHKLQRYVMVHALSEEEATEYIKPLSKAIAGMPKAVITLSPRGVGEHLISLVNLLESLGRSIVPVMIRMIFKGEFPESPLYLGVGGRFCHTEDIVITSFSYHVASLVNILL